ncbi:YybH family protein [Neorhizobium sp. DT-125]|uniref:YybH family protein n=1 Tax=Neorhizobium sp. DT-125 TaxID=3396163 RepID=UPI003F1AFD1F
MPATTATGEESEIRKCLDELAQALRARDVDALMAHYAPDTVVFDIRPPQRIEGADAYRKNFETWFGSVEGPIHYEIRELGIAVKDDVAFCHSLSHVRSKRINGEKADYWVRVTSGLRKTNGRWMIAHEHISMPIDLQTMRAQSDFRS